MKKLMFLAIAFIAICLVSCGDKKDPNSTFLLVNSELGAYGDYMSIEQDTMFLELQNQPLNGEDSVKAIVSAISFKVNQDVASDMFLFTVEILDKNHVKIAELDEIELAPTKEIEIGDFEEVLAAGNLTIQIKKSMIWSQESQNTWNTIWEKGRYVLIKPYDPFDSGAVVEAYEKVLKNRDSYDDDDDDEDEDDDDDEDDF